MDFAKSPSLRQKGLREKSTTGNAVNIDGEKKTLADVKEGMNAQCKLSEDGKSVTAINVGKKKKSDA